MPVDAMVDDAVTNIRDQVEEYKYLRSLIFDVNKEVNKWIGQH